MLKARRLSRKLVSFCKPESTFIYAPTESKQTKIDELLAYIEERLQELEEEKEELREFQQNDRERRCLEYALYQRELLDVSTALEEVCASTPIKVTISHLVPD